MGSSSAAQTVTITNDGLSQLLVTGVGLTGADAGQLWLGTDTGEDARLDANQTCTTEVIFAPRTPGA